MTDPVPYVADGTVLGDDVRIFPWALIGRLPTPHPALSTQPEGEYGPVRIGSGCVVGAHAVIYAGVEIGPHTLIGDGAKIREGVKIGARCVIAMGVTINRGTVIGDRVRIMDNSHITAEMLIEDDVFVGPLVSTSNERRIGSGHYNPPVLRLGCRIGQGSAILAGVEVGNGATVGAGSVVTRWVKPASTVMGAPAREVVEKPRRWTGLGWIP